jgi:hypothetical protein
MYVCMYVCTYTVTSYYYMYMRVRVYYDFYDISNCQIGGFVGTAPRDQDDHVLDRFSGFVPF